MSLILWATLEWYTSSYMMTSCAFQLFYGKLYVFYPANGFFSQPFCSLRLGLLFVEQRPARSLSYGAIDCRVWLLRHLFGGVVVMVHTIPFAKSPYSKVFSVPFLALHLLLARSLERHSLLMLLGAGVRLDFLFVAFAISKRMLL